MGPAGVLEITDLPARIVYALNQQEGGMSGAQLAKELYVTPSAVSKAVKGLLELGIIRRDNLPVSPNVKIYALVIKVKTEEDFKHIRKTVSPTLIEILTKRLRGDENLALIYAWELEDYLRSLSESERGAVMQKVMQEVTGRGIKT
jgi:DNA-binding Lrp family transcriptional regulator